MPKSQGLWSQLSSKEVTSVEVGLPTNVPAPRPPFPFELQWHTGPWRDIFDEQIALIREDIARAKVQDRIIIYMSCPISSRGGGWAGTNVDVAKHIERRILDRWGEAFWILNPAQYQLESKAGTGLIERHARKLGIDLPRLRSMAEATGGDYLRMWTKVLVENDEKLGPVNSGQSFDAFYFIGPQDVHSFFCDGGVTLTAGIQSYFARTFAMNPDFRDYFSVPGITWGASPTADYDAQESAHRDMWAKRRFDFLRFYGVRASANFSLGSHDEWNIFRWINQQRRFVSAGPEHLDGDVGGQLAAFFDGVQVDPSSTEDSLSRGYGI